MTKNYYVKVNGKIDFLLKQNEVSVLDVTAVKNSKYHILLDNKSVEAELVRSSFYKKEYTIRVNSNTYQIKITNPLDILIKKLGFSLGPSKKYNIVKAPMPGIIIGLPIKKGDAVKQGDTVLILEAMKMENVILCQKDGIVKSVFVKLGETVEKGKLLVELE